VVANIQKFVTFQQLIPLVYNSIRTFFRPIESQFIWQNWFEFCDNSVSVWMRHRKTDYTKENRAIRQYSVTHTVVHSRGYDFIFVSQRFLVWFYDFTQIRKIAKSFY